MNPWFAAFSFQFMQWLKQFIVVSAPWAPATLDARALLQTHIERIILQVCLCFSARSQFGFVRCNCRT
jgi:hypothetical protein